MNKHQRNLIAALSLCAAVAPNLASAVAISGQGAWESTLQGRDLDGNLETFEAYYDTAHDITWLADASYAMTSGYDTDGLMTWGQAMTWAASLDLDGVAGADGWRLPDTLQPDASCSSQVGGVSYGYNCTGSEMGILFYNVLGNTAGSLTNTGPFSNVQSSNYWSATEYASDTFDAWVFYTNIGSQEYYVKTNSHYAWAVYSGDVNAVPVPAAAWLFGSGLFGVFGSARRRSVYVDD